MSEEKHIPEGLLKNAFHLRSRVDRPKPYSTRSMNSSTLLALSGSILGQGDTSLPSLSPVPKKPTHKSTRLVPVSSFRTKVSVQPHSPQATLLLGEGLVLGLNPHRERKVREGFMKGLEQAAEHRMFAEINGYEGTAVATVSREGTLSPKSPKKRLNSPVRDRKFLFRRDKSLISVGVTEAGSTTTVELMGLHKAELDPTWMDTKLRSLSREEIARVSGLAKALEPFAGIEEWRLSLDGRREEFSQLLVQKFTHEFGPADVNVLIDIFLNPKDLILKPLAELQAAQILKAMFPVISGHIFMEKQKKQIQYLQDKMGRDPTSRHTIVEVACSQFFSPEWPRIKVFIPASKIFVSMLIKAKIAYYSTISFRARNTLSRYINDTTKIKYLAKPQDLRTHKLVRAGMDESRVFLQELKEIVGKESVADHKLKESLKDIPADDQVFNSELRGMIGEIRGILSYGAGEPSLRRESSRAEVKKPDGSKERLKIIYRQGSNLSKSLLSKSMILSPK